MKILFSREEIARKNGQKVKLIKNTTYLPDDFVEKKLNEHCLNLKGSAYRNLIYINDKGNFVFTKTDIVPWITDNEFKKMVEGLKEDIQKGNRSPKDCFYYFLRKTYDVPEEQEYALFQMLKKVKGVWISTKKIVVKSPTEIYYINGHKIRRINLNKKENRQLVEHLMFEYFKYEDITNEHERFTKMLSVYCSVFPKIDFLVKKVQVPNSIYQCFEWLNFFDSYKEFETLKYPQKDLAKIKKEKVPYKAFEKYLKTNYETLLKEQK